MADYSSAAGIASGDREATLPLIRVPSVGKITGVITTHSITELWTHFYRGHTVGCASDGCPGCDANCPKRYEAYCGFYNVATRHHRILGLTVGATRQILDAVGSLTQVRGLQLTLGRKTKKPNSRVIVECGMIFADRQHLPDPFQVIEHLRRIWGVEYEATVEQLKSAARDGADGIEVDKQALLRLIGSQPREVDAGECRNDEDGQLHLPG